MSRLVAVTLLSILVVLTQAAPVSARTQIMTLTGSGATTRTSTLTATLSFDFETDLTFTTAGGDLAIYFSAECSVKSEDQSTWVDIDILIDGVAVPPTDSDDAFCTSTGPDSPFSGRIVSASRDAIVTLPAGTYSVSVVGRFPPEVFQFGEFWRIGAKTLVLVLREAP